jgi:hypothetical protein
MEMNAAIISKILRVFKENNVPGPFSIEVHATQFKQLKSDIYVLSSYKAPGDLKPNELMIYGVRVVGRLCECGAHPEDWE